MAEQEWRLWRQRSDERSRQRVEEHQLLERAYAACLEAEGRADQQRECERQCAALPDTAAGRERRRYLQRQALHSPAYFSGSLLCRRSPDTHATGRVLGLLAVLPWLLE